MLCYHIKGDYMSYKYIAWDWNGTLIDDVQIGVDCMNIILEHHNYPQRLDVKRYREIFCFPVEEYYKSTGLDLEKHSFNELADLYIKSNDELIKNAKLVENAKKVLDELKKEGYSQLIISATEQGRLINQVQQYGIESYFDKVLGKSDYLATTKIDIAKNWLNDYNINPRDVLFVGDTLHDYEVAKSLDFDCVLISGGHQSEAILSKSGAEIFDDIKEIIDYLQKEK